MLLIRFSMGISDTRIVVVDDAGKVTARCRAAFIIPRTEAGLHMLGTVNSL